MYLYKSVLHTGCNSEYLSCVLVLLIRINFALGGSEKYSSVSQDWNLRIARFGKGDVGCWVIGIPIPYQFSWCPPQSFCGYLHRLGNYQWKRWAFFYISDYIFMTSKICTYTSIWIISCTLQQDCKVSMLEVMPNGKWCGSLKRCFHCCCLQVRWSWILCQRLLSLMLRNYPAARHPCSTATSLPRPLNLWR